MTENKNAELEDLVDRVIGEVTPAKIVNFLRHYNFKGNLYVYDPEQNIGVPISKFFDFEINGVFYPKGKKMKYQEIIDSIKTPYDLKQVIGLMFYPLIEQDFQKKFLSRESFADEYVGFHVQEFVPNKGFEEKNWKSFNNLWLVKFSIRLSVEYKDQFEKAIMKENSGAAGFKNSYTLHAWPGTIGTL